jgi:ABC-type branched-subunit amino acid transport system ATPase component
LIVVFLIEQDLQQTLEITYQAYVMENGRITLSGESKPFSKQIQAMEFTQISVANF